MLNSNKIFATELSKFSEKVVKQNQILLYRVFLMVCLWINRHPSVSTSPLTNAFLYSILFFIHKGISIFCKILFPLTAPFDTKKSTALVLVDITIRVFWLGDRKSTRLNSSHQIISYAVFCLKKKNHY